MHVITYLKTNKRPTSVDVDLKPYIPIWDELSVVDGTLLRDSRIIIPTSLRKKIVEIVHEGHLGIVKTKGLIRTCVMVS